MNRWLPTASPDHGDVHGSWSFADIGEVAIYCPECAEREFGGQEVG